MSEPLVWNLEAEQQLLGALLTNNRNFEKVGDLKAEHFFDPVHQRIAAAIISRIQGGQLASPVLLKGDLAGDLGLEELGGAGYLARLSGAAIATSACGDYAVEVRSWWGKRQLTAVLNEGLQRVARPDGGSASEIASKVETSLANIQRSASEKPLTVSFLRASMDALTQINDAYQGQTGLSGISTGLRDLDDLIGGFAKGRLYVLAGRPAMGKSALALNIAAKAALRGEGVFFASLEMPAAELSTRFYSQVMAQDGMTLPYSDMGRGRMEEHEFRALVGQMKKYEVLPIELGDVQVKDTNKLRQAIVRTHAKFEAIGGLKLVVVDYLQLLRPPGMVKTIERVGEASQLLKEFAREFEVPVLALAQLSRGVEARDNKRPMLSDIRDSGQVEQDADTVMFAYRHAYYLSQEVKSEQDATKRLDKHALMERVQNDLEIIVEKQRSGRAGTAYCEIHLPTNVVRDKPKQEDFEL